MKPDQVTEIVFGPKILRCGNCGHRYRPNEASVVGTRAEYWFFKMKCYKCTVEGIAVAIIAAIEDKVPTPAGPAVLEVDDVLNAHADLFPEDDANITMTDVLKWCNTKKGVTQ